MKYLIVTLFFFAAVYGGKPSIGRTRQIFSHRSFLNNVGARIVGGEIVKPHSVPHQVALKVFSGLLFDCGGSLISDTWVLTAAHCGEVDGHPSVLLGKHDLTIKEDEELVIKAKRVIVHEEWDINTLLNDIALIELPEPINFTNAIQPIKLPNRSLINETFAGRKATTTGWGREHDGGPVSHYLRTVTSDILTNAKCQKDFNNSTGAPVAPTHVCLDGSQGKSACHGDSGGPLVVDQDGALIQIGITSYGSDDGCESGYPTAYTRLTSFIDWIEKNTGLDLN